MNPNKKKLTKVDLIKTTISTLGFSQRYINKVTDSLISILFEIINNVTATVENDSNITKTLLIEQIFSTVKWRESIIKMSEDGVSNYIEIGPGKVLSGMVKRTVKDANCFSINSIADIKNFINEFKK